MKQNLEINDVEFLESFRNKKIFPQHIHWDGSIPAEDLFRFAEEKSETLLKPGLDWNHDLIKYNSEEERRIKSADELKNIMFNLQKYWLPEVFDYTIRFMQTEEDIINSAKAHASYLKSQNAPYAETRFAPQYHTNAGLSIESVIEHAVEGFRQGKDETGVDVRLIISIARERSVEEAISVVKAVINANKKYPDYVLGIDLACVESLEYPPEKFYEAFKLTFDTPLKRTSHIGEMCDEETNLKFIETGLDLLRLHAGSHAISLSKSPYLIEKFVKNDVRLESNPVCNATFFINNIADLRLDYLVEKGVKVTLNPDDPAIIKNGDMIHNFYHIGKLYGKEFVNETIKNSINTAWGLSKEQKEKYVKEI